MNLLTKLTLLFLFTLTFSSVFGAVNPPDTTTKFIDKTASVYFLEEGKVLYEEGKIKAAALTKLTVTVDVKLNAFVRI